jgi:hypothetical protein
MFSASAFSYEQTILIRKPSISFWPKWTRERSSAGRIRTALVLCVTYSLGGIVPVGKALYACGGPVRR